MISVVRIVSSFRSCEFILILFLKSKSVCFVTSFRTLKHRKVEMSLLIAELTATCNALGYAVNGKKYFLDKECKGSYVKSVLLD